MHGGSISRDRKMRKGKVESLCMSYGRIRVGKEGEGQLISCSVHGKFEAVLDTQGDMAH